MAQSASQNNRTVGSQGEVLAVAHLRAQGMTILATNYRIGKMGEIDIVARDGDTLTFVEVKLRRTTKYGTPEESVTPAKQRTIRRMAEYYLMRNNISDTPCRFDVIAIEVHHNEQSIRHHKDCF
jgi:putative endonuclease